MAQGRNDPTGDRIGTVPPSMVREKVPPYSLGTTRHWPCTYSMQSQQELKVCAQSWQQTLFREVEKGPANSLPIQIVLQTLRNDILLGDDKVEHMHAYRKKERNKHIRGEPSFSHYDEYYSIPWKTCMYNMHVSRRYTSCMSCRELAKHRRTCLSCLSCMSSSISSVSFFHRKQC